MDDDALQIYHDPTAHRDDLRSVIDSQEREIGALRAIEAAARSLIAQKGRHHTQTAYERLVDALKTPNV